MENNHIYELFIKYQKGKLSSSEYQELKIWLNASSDNQAAFIVFLRVKKIEAQQQMLLQINPSEIWEQQLQKKNSIKPRRRWFYWTAAAIISGCCWMSYNYIFTQDQSSQALAELFPNRGKEQAIFLPEHSNPSYLETFFFQWPDTFKYTINKDYHLQQYSSLKKEQNFEIYVPHGGEYSLTLPDGTKVWLNAGTLLSYSSQPSSIRSVRLEGEAYFEVAKSKTPFEVKASGNTVHVLGTKFNVRAYPEQPFQVTLSEGNVQVYGNGKSMQLHPGQQLSAPDFQILTVDTNLYTSWTHGIFEFNNTPLNEIILQLERWYNVNMEFKTEELKKLRFTGTILKKESLGHSLEMIQKVSNIKFSKQDKCILIEKKES